MFNISEEKFFDEKPFFTPTWLNSYKNLCFIYKNYTHIIQRIYFALHKYSFAFEIDY